MENPSVMQGLIEIVPYRPAWPEEFLVAGRGLRRALGASARRIDHIGSTAVPGLAAKDVIDVQVTVEDFDPDLESLLTRLGYRKRPHLSDHIPPGADGPPADWRKWVFTEPLGMRRLNLHVRQCDRPNQRYPLLFRDYLRLHPAAAEAYGLVKQALARQHSHDKEAYYEVKDPVCDILMQGAEAWALVGKWNPGSSDC